MEGALGVSSAVFGQNGSVLFLAALLIIVLVGMYFLYVNMGNTMPKISGFQDMEGVVKRNEAMIKEGFYGGVVRGAGIPDCLRTSSEAAKVFSMFYERFGGTEEGKPDLVEFRNLLSHLTCFKKDLMGVAQQVEATRYQPFLTQLDLEPIAETTARCFAKTIPSRDLDLAFIKWGKRGIFLISRLCTAASFTESQHEEAVKLFNYVLNDVKDVAKDRCLTGTPTIADQPISPRDPRASTDPTELSGGAYTGYY